MSEAPVDRPDVDFRTLPEPVRLEDTIAEQAASDAPEPYVVRDTEWDYTLRHIGG
ncbi:heme biosynthesis protein HemY [Cellulomonas sp. APG4]|uniref:heme biosynthesis protein HemY n=1 Tax=Cellulomonas sp. APG4 TaxID=1538656 RepID=UPI00137B7A1A|nr:heme biosynthesis protein HemY [Cellulomonas sp. APG4]NCT92563.1 heme biosynthesis protein HemY [Cellulomonas sp. APG4]